MDPRFPVTLETPVGTVATRRVVTVYPDEPATSVRRMLRENRARIALVVDRDGKLLGVITRGDVLLITSRKSNARARDIMSEPILTLEKDETIERAVKRMLRADEWYVPVLDDGRVYGVLGLEHVIQRMIDEGEDILNSIPVGDIMTREVETVHPDDTLATVWDKMVSLRYAGLPVVDEKGRLVGIITQYDLLAKGATLAREASGGPRGDKIREYMTWSVETALEEDPAARPARLMVNRGYGRIPVVADRKTRKLVGIVDREDIVKLLF